MPRQTDTKEKIDRAAMRLIAAHGVDAISMRDIAREVDVSEAALYRHFKNKESLVWELFRANYEALAEELAAAQEARQTLADKLGAMVRVCSELFDSDRDRFVFMLLAQHIQKIAPNDYVPALPLLLERALEAAIVRDEIPPQDASLSTSMVMGTVLQSALHCLYHRPEALKLTPFAPTIADACGRIVQLRQ
jgi:TetR/AcrR family transcriptional regulator, repressor of fatR-cypB operon